jgi:hypothetical protein
MSQFLCAQWTKKDSLNLNRILNSKKEIRLNSNAINSIDFGRGVVKVSLTSILENPALKYDETLPAVYPDKPGIKPALNLYTPVSLRNHSIYQQMTGTNNKFDFLVKPTNWAHTWQDAKFRNSREEIEATGVHYNIMGERANNRAIYTFTPVANGISLGNDMDLMKPFTKEFWDRKGKARRARTLEVLEPYGDSTTVLIREAVYKLK